MMASGNLPKPFGHLRRSRKTVMLIVVTVATAMTFIAAGHSEFPAFHESWIRQTAIDLGVFGPLALIGLMVLAIVVSPIPSGPIAVAAGALYGASEGAIVSIIGAEIGALIAFSMSRYFGYDAVRRSQNPIMKFIAVPRSQRGLMWIVFASRLIPFISFDAISYATGVTNLSFGRFAIATGLGIVPICSILAMMGAGMATSGMDWMLVVMVGGVITLVPAIVAAVRTWCQR
jgi:uncharacterized membrane protein YdjX (TVP38/TMEM64 family)